MWESIAQSSLKAARALYVRSALNPMLWLTAIGMPLCFVGAWAFKADPLMYHVLIVAGLAPLAMTCAGFLYFMFKDPGKLQSEAYQLRHEVLQMIQQKTGELTIDPTSLPAITNPAVSVLPARNNPTDPEEATE